MVGYPKDSNCGDMLPAIGLKGEEVGGWSLAPSEAGAVENRGER